MAGDPTQSLFWLLVLDVACEATKDCGRTAFVNDCKLLTGDHCVIDEEGNRHEQQAAHDAARRGDGRDAEVAEQADGPPAAVSALSKLCTQYSPVLD